MQTVASIRAENSLYSLSGHYEANARITRLQELERGRAIIWRKEIAGQESTPKRKLQGTDPRISSPSLIQAVTPVSPRSLSYQSQDSFLLLHLWCITGRGQVRKCVSPV